MRTDGTAAGTELVVDQADGTDDAFAGPGDFTFTGILDVIDDRLYMRADIGGVFEALTRYDARDGQLVEFAGVENPRGVTGANGRVYATSAFAALYELIGDRAVELDDYNGSQLANYRAVAVGTRVVLTDSKRIYTQPRSGGPATLRHTAAISPPLDLGPFASVGVQIADTAYFFAVSNDDGYSLWKSTGRTSTTEPIGLAAGVGNVTWMRALDSAFVVVARNGNNDRAVFRVDPVARTAEELWVPFNPVPLGEFEDLFAFGGAAFTDPQAVLLVRDDGRQGPVPNGISSRATLRLALGEFIVAADPSSRWGVYTYACRPGSSSAVSARICPGDTLIFGNQTLTEAGTYTRSLTNTRGCDTTVVLTLTADAFAALTVDAPDSVRLGDTVVVTATTQDSIRWPDGSVGPTYRVAAERLGELELTLTQITPGGCERAVAFGFTVVASSDTRVPSALTGLRVAPNPAGNYVRVAGWRPGLSVELRTVAGQLLARGREGWLQLRAVPRGVYHVRVRDEATGAMASLRLVRT